LELLRDLIRFAIVQALGAVAPLKDEALAALRRCDFLFQRLDFPGDDERREARKLRDDVVERLLIRIRRLLASRFAVPTCGMPFDELRTAGHGSRFEVRRIRCARLALVAAAQKRHGSEIAYRFIRQFTRKRRPDLNGVAALAGSSSGDTG